MGDGNCPNFGAFHSTVHYKAECGIIHYFTLTGNCSKILYQKIKEAKAAVEVLGAVGSAVQNMSDLRGKIEWKI